MYKELDKVFYIDVFDGIVKEGDFIENDKNGLWIKVKGESANTFVYSDMADKRVYKQMETAVQQ